MRTNEIDDNFQAKYHQVLQTKPLMIMYYLVGEYTYISRHEYITEIQQNDCIIRVVIYITNHYPHINQYLWFWEFYYIVLHPDYC